jgi:hypothetical protein
MRVIENLVLTKQKSAPPFGRTLFFEKFQTGQEVTQPEEIRV